MLSARHLSAQRLKQSAWDDGLEEENGVPPEGSLRQAVAQRWASATALLERVLVYYSDLVNHSAKYEGVLQEKDVGAHFKREVIA